MCRFNDEVRRDPVSVLKTLIYQLAKTVPAYRIRWAKLCKDVCGGSVAFCRGGFWQFVAWIPPLGRFRRCISARRLLAAVRMFASGLPKLKASELFEWLLLKPLQAGARDDDLPKSTFIAIDGLDESLEGYSLCSVVPRTGAEKKRANTMMQLLPDLLVRLPPAVRFVVTSEPKAYVTGTIKVRPSWVGGFGFASRSQPAVGLRHAEGSWLHCPIR